MGTANHAGQDDMAGNIALSLVLRVLNWIRCFWEGVSAYFA
jgi:hypothetical protein